MQLRYGEFERKDIQIHTYDSQHVDLRDSSNANLIVKSAPIKASLVQLMVIMEGSQKASFVLIDLQASPGEKI